MAPDRTTRRDLLRTTGIALTSVAAAGCIDDGSTLGAGNGTTDRVTTSTRTTDAGTPDQPTDLPTTEPPIQDTPHTSDEHPTHPTERPTETRYPTNEVSYDHAITVENDSGSAKTVEVTVEEVSEESTGDSTVYHEETYTVAASTDRDLFNVTDLGLEGDRRLTVTATYDGETKRATIRTTVCYGDVLITFSTDGEFGMTYSVC